MHILAVSTTVIYVVRYVVADSFDTTLTVGVKKRLLHASHTSNGMGEIFTYSPYLFGIPLIV